MSGAVAYSEVPTSAFGVRGIASVLGTRAGSTYFPRVLAQRFPRIQRPDPVVDVHRFRALLFGAEHLPEPIVKPLPPRGIAVHRQAELGGDLFGTQRRVQPDHEL